MPYKVLSKGSVFLSLDCGQKRKPSHMALKVDSNAKDYLCKRMMTN
jgi:hypothetical protein